MIINGETLTLAMVSVFSPPDQDILKQSVYTVCACKYCGHLADSYEVVDVKQIVSVVAMVPLPMTPEEAQHPEDHAGRFFVVEKPGLDVACLAGHAQPLDEDVDTNN